MRTAGLTGLVTFALCLGAAGARGQDVNTAGAAADSTQFVRSTPSYSSGGQRDPFNSLAPEPVEEGRNIKDMFDYEEGALKGIVSTADGPYAMVVDGEGLSYVLYENSRVRGGYVTRISDDTVYLNIIKYGRAMTIMFRSREAQSLVVQQNGQGETTIRKPGITVDYTKTGAVTGQLSIDDVIVSQSGIRTIEEEWFGVSRNAEPGKPTEPVMARNMFAQYDPPDGAEIMLPYELEWTDAPGDIAEYVLTIDDDEDYSSPAVTISGIPSSAYVMTDELRLPAEMPLYWRVIAIDADGNRMTSFRSDMTFTIQSEEVDR